MTTLLRTIGKDDLDRGRRLVHLGGRHELNDIDQMANLAVAECASRELRLRGNDSLEAKRGTKCDAELPLEGRLRIGNPGELNAERVDMDVDLTDLAASAALMQLARRVDHRVGQQA